MTEIDPRVTVGRHTYGHVRGTFLLWMPDERIEVGAFCSFSANVRLFGGGEHKASVTTFPLRTLLVDPEGGNVEATSKGPTRVGSDCLLGWGAMVLSGVTVGHGAIVGAGAVVASDVPPYAVAAGNPARVVRMRFEEQTVERLLAVAWWNWDDDTIRERVDLFDDVERFLAVAEADRRAGERPARRSGLFRRRSAGGS